MFNYLQQVSGDAIVMAQTLNALVSLRLIQHFTLSGHFKELTGVVIVTTSVLKRQSWQVYKGSLGELVRRTFASNVVFCLYLFW